MGLFLQCLIAFLYWFVAYMIAPWYARVLLFAVWAGLLALGIRWLRSSMPARTLAIPFLATGALVAIVALGEALSIWQE